MPKKELAKGYTTGTCAQAATRAAMQMLFTGEKVEQVSVELPQGEKLQLDITDIQRKYTCLLYTSPSPRDMRRSRMPAYA